MNGLILGISSFDNNRCAMCTRHVCQSAITPDDEAADSTSPMCVNRENQTPGRSLHVTDPASSGRSLIELRPFEEDATGIPQTPSRRG